MRSDNIVFKQRLGAVSLLIATFTEWLQRASANFDVNFNRVENEKGDKQRAKLFTITSLSPGAAALQVHKSGF